MPNSSSDTAPPAVKVVQPGGAKRTGDYPQVQYRSRPKIITADPKDRKENKFARLVEYLDGVQNNKFTGYIKVNFSQGSIGRIERFEEILSK